MVAQKCIGDSRDLVELSASWPGQVLQYASQADAVFSLQAIRDWLHSIPTSLYPAEIRRGYLPYTKNKLKQCRRTGAPLPRGIVSELDPDAVLRAGEDGSMGRLETEDTVSLVSAVSYSHLEPF